MSEWMVRRGSRPPVGPFSTAFILRGLSSGKLPSDAEVCRVGADTWRPVHDLAEHDPDDDAPTGVVQAPWFAQPMADEAFDDEATRVFLALSPEDGDDDATRVLDSPLAAATRPPEASAADEPDDATRVLPALGSPARAAALRSTIPRPPSASTRPLARPSAAPRAGTPADRVRSAPPAPGRPAPAAPARGAPPAPVRTAPPAPVRAAPPAASSGTAGSPASPRPSPSSPRSKPPALPIPPEQKRQPSAPAHVLPAVPNAHPSAPGHPAPARVPGADVLAAARAAAVVPPLGSAEALLDADDDEVAGIRDVPQEVRDSFKPGAGEAAPAQSRSSEPRPRQLSMYPSSIIVSPTSEPTDRRPALSRVAPPPDPWLRALLALILVLAIALAVALVMLSSR